MREIVCKYEYVEKKSVLLQWALNKDIKSLSGP